MNNIKYGDVCCLSKVYGFIVSKHNTKLELGGHDDCGFPFLVRP